MEIVGIGTDLVRVCRMDPFLKKESLRRKTFGEEEVAYALTHRDPLPVLAARFAVKESIIKILGDVTILELKNIQVVGPGQVELFGEAKESMVAKGIRRFQVSISHEQEYALAFVIGLG